jgi:hypothetical protein
MGVTVEAGSKGLVVSAINGHVQPFKEVPKLFREEENGI